MDGMQVPVPPGTKTGYSRASTRPTSATTTCSDSPRSRPQRPLSARSTGSRDARNSACYEADFATNSWSDWQSAPSRPTSAKSQAGQVASTPQTARRLSNASGYEMIPVRPDSARSTRTPEHHSLEEQIIASPDFGRRCVEEELSEPVLTRIPNSIATQLEKQVATAIGLRGRARLVPRLPRSVVSCKHGSDCCWRWLARAALEEIWGSSLATLSLAECVKKMKEDTDKQQAACNKAIQSVRSCSFHLSLSLSIFSSLACGQSFEIPASLVIIPLTTRENELRSTHMHTRRHTHTLAQKHLIELLMWNASHVQKTIQ